MPRAPFISTKPKHGIRVIQQHFDDDGEAQGGDAEVIRAEGEHRQAKKEADLGSKQTGRSLQTGRK